MKNEIINKIRQEIDILSAEIQAKSINKTDAIKRIIGILGNIILEENNQFANEVVNAIYSVPVSYQGESTYRELLIAKIIEMRK